MAKDDRDKIISERMAHALIMRDVMDGLEDFATMQAFEPWPGAFEIISIETPGVELQNGEDLDDHKFNSVARSLH